MKARLAFVGLVCCLLLVSCSTKFKLGIVNHIGSSATISLAGKSVTLANGEMGRFEYPTETEGHVFTISADNCVYQYVMPTELGGYVKLDNPDGIVVVQLERGARLYALPPTATGVQSVLDSNVDALQKGEFPVGPVKKSCTGATKK